jgi:flavin-binding protein dodecin
MPVDAAKASHVWNRYCFARDNGHNRYVMKADLCERHFAGDQWDVQDKARLALVRRPALTINKILGTVGNVLGEQIGNRSEIAFRPRNGANAATADTLNKVFKQISDANQLDWKRSDMFADGIIGSRGYIDIRLGFNDQMQGEVVYEHLNPKNVIPDPDADQYDPDTWSEVFTTKWVTADDIAVLYSPEDAEFLRNRESSAFPYGYDSIELGRDRFGSRMSFGYHTGQDDSNVLRNIRLIERQYRELDKQKHFVEVDTGDMRPIPADFTRDRIAFFVQKFGFKVVTKLVRRIKWTVIADNVVLHDDWSPYKHFTPVPYFPHFRRGTTIGLVENLTGPQELLNKVTSQELHVLNTTANSGWKMKTGVLTTMSVEELEQRGAETGLVVEVNDMDGLEKITPNATPQGLDRMSFKAEESIKSISGVSDSMQGFDREDVAAKAIQEKKKSGSTNLVKPLDNLVRTDYFIARNTLDLIQEHYTEARILTVLKDSMTGETEDVGINQVDPATGNVVNDLMLGEFGAVITSVPHKETLEDSQFDQAVALRELGVKIPDSVLIKNSRLLDKAEILEQMSNEANSEAAQKAAATQQALADAEVVKTQGEGAVKHADAGLKTAKIAETQAKTQEIMHGEPDQDDGTDSQVKIAEAAHGMDLKERQFDHEQNVDAATLRLKQQDQDNKQREAAKAAADDRVMKRQQAAKAAAAGKVSYTQP